MTFEQSLSSHPLDVERDTCFPEGPPPFENHHSPDLFKEGRQHNITLDRVVRITATKNGLRSTSCAMSSKSLALIQKTEKKDWKACFWPAEYSLSIAVETFTQQDRGDCENFKLSMGNAMPK